MDSRTPEPVQTRRRSDAAVAEMLSGAPDEAVVKTYGGPGKRTRILYACGCVAVEPLAATGRLEVLACPTHAELQAKLRRRRTDRYEG